MVIQVARWSYKVIPDDTRAFSRREIANKNPYVFEVTCVVVADYEDLWQQIVSYRQQKTDGYVSTQQTSSSSEIRRCTPAVNPPPLNHDYCIECGV